MGAVGTGTGMGAIEFCETAARSDRALLADITVSKSVIPIRAKLLKIKICPIADTRRTRTTSG